jgi:hypothetical protein
MRIIILHAHAAPFAEKEEMRRHLVQPHWKAFRPYRVNSLMVEEFRLCGPRGSADR